MKRVPSSSTASTTASSPSDGVSKEALFRGIGVAGDRVNGATSNFAMNAFEASFASTERFNPMAATSGAGLSSHGGNFYDSYSSHMLAQNGGHSFLSMQ